MGIFNKKESTEAPKSVAASEPVGKAPSKKEAPAKKAKEEVKKTGHGQSRFGNHIVKPVISEKAARLHGVGQYVFVIAPQANKVTVKQALKDMYGVDAVHVSIVKNPGKSLRRRYGIGQTSVRRKAVVRLKAGQSINVYEGI